MRQLNFILKRGILLGLVLLATLHMSFAQGSYTWTGATSSDFEDPANWSGDVPTFTANDGVFNIGAGSNPCVWGATQTGGQYYTVVMQEGGEFHVNDTLFLDYLSAPMGTNANVYINDGGLINNRATAQAYIMQGANIHIEAGGKMEAKPFYIWGRWGDDDCQLYVEGGLVDMTGFAPWRNGVASNTARVHVSSGGIVQHSTGTTLSGWGTDGGILPADGSLLVYVTDDDTISAVDVAFPEIVTLTEGQPIGEVFAMASSGDATANATITTVQEPSAETVVAAGLAKVSVTATDFFGNVIEGTVKVNVVNATAKAVAYVTNDATLDETVAKDPVLAMYLADPNLDVTVINQDADDTGGPLDMTGYDLIIAQESYGSSSVIYQPGRTLGIGTYAIPVIYNKVYALRDGRGFTGGAAGSGGEVEADYWLKSFDTAHELFKGITFAPGDSVQMFKRGAFDDGNYIREATGVEYFKAFQYGNGVAVDVTSGSNTLLGMPNKASAVGTANIGVNLLTTGAVVGSQTLQADMITIPMNIGGMSSKMGANFTGAGLTLWRNAAYHLTGITVPAEGVPNPPRLVDGDVVFVTDDEADSVQIAFLESVGMSVTTWWPASVASVTTEEETALNAGDLIIIGRSAGSSDVATLADLFHYSNDPILNNNLWGSRNSRLKWFDSNSIANIQGAEAPATQKVHVKLPGDPIFSDATLDGDDSLELYYTPNDILSMTAAAYTSSNAEIVAANDDWVAIARFNSTDEYYTGAGVYPLGYRTYFGFGNDNLYTTDATVDTINYFPITEGSQEVYLREIERLIALGTTDWVVIEDDDGDGVINAEDVCEGFDDNVDTDGDGVPDGCDICSSGDDNADADGDGVPDACDLCAAGSDKIDVDNDGIPDACDDELPELVTIAFIGAYDEMASYDQTLFDSLSQYVKVHYIPSGVFNEASYDSLYVELGIEGIVISESIGSSALTNFGPARDAFPVPSISLEAGTYTNSWGDEGFMTDNSAAIWGYGGANEEAVDLQWKIVDPLHESIFELGWQQDQIITWSDATPERGIPYLHGFATTVNVIAVAARESGGTAADPSFNAEFVQDLAVSVAEFPIQRSYYMNVARAYHDINTETGLSKATQDFWDIMRWSVYYMFDAYPQTGDPNALAVDPLLQGNAFQVYPNPSEGPVNISFVAEKNQLINIKIIDVTGRTVYENVKMAETGRNRINLDLSTALKTGAYFVSTEIDGEKAVKRLIIK
ncbi:T9SS type A sorting domain-containing protein [Marinoscillum sp. MHG1-6]|uniref:T9SS type A sorting domain-containing protein n=1 Tax=Marinoscillum sp. MHG1-6 TaxID=2959627 RepID=UPI00215840A1|nr:T9SS type A sorting domain-containing protein [Marinoscillum sp. MHG1-6]